MTSSAWRDARGVTSRWLSGAEVTICTDTRRSARRRPTRERFERMTTEVRETREAFLDEHPELETRGKEARRDETTRDAFVEWMVRAKEISPAVFERELTFEREFSTNARPFTRAMEAIETWVATSLRRLEERFPGRVDDGWRTGVERDWKLLAIDEEEYERTFARKDDARDAIALDHTIDTALMHDFPASFRSPPPPSAANDADRGFALERFPALPLEVLPPEHFVLGIYSGVSHASSSLTSSNAASTETFSSPWFNPAWIGLLHYERGGASPTQKKQRARVWRGKNLDMIVYGEDERRSWASKIGAFLKRARSALGNRALDRGEWGGSILDSVIGANLTQNVTDVLSSTAFMNLAARFPYNAATAERHDACLYVHRVVGEMFDRLCANDECATGDVPRTPRKPEKLPMPPENDPFDTPVRPKREAAIKNTAVKKKPKKKKVNAASIIKEVLKRPDPPRSEQMIDQVDWYAVLEAPLVEIVKCIRCRGMHWMLARRIKTILKRVMVQRGYLSLEFLRKTPTMEAREYLLALDGMGVKTTSCVLLLALHRTDFPVDVNVGRIMARLGWVPLESETALEELAQYAPEPAVYTFLRERLNSFDVEMLYELHYHMITLGKVFCAKLMPNCGACPLRDVCEYAMQGGKCVDRPDGHSGLASLQPPTTAHAKQPVDIEDTGKSAPHSSTVHQNVGKNESTHVLRAIVTAGKTWDKKGRPAGKLATNVLLLGETTSREDIQMAYVRLSRLVHPDKNSHPNAATAFNYITTARRVALNISSKNTLAKSIDDELEDMIRLSSVDQEIPMEEMTGMELSGNVVKASKIRAERVGWLVPPEMLLDDLVQALGGTHRAEGCIMVPIDSDLQTLDDVRSETIKVAVLIPCNSAMNKKFPLHGTYFQVNEMFLDETSSKTPLDVSKGDLQKCKRIRVLVGMSIVSISRGMCRAQVTAAFATQRICVRSWHRATKRPGPLPTWLCPFFPQPIEKPLEPEPDPFIRRGPQRPVKQVLSPVSAMQSLVTRNPRIAELVANAPKDSVEHRLLSQFESLFKGRKHFYLPSPIGTKRKTSPTKTDGSPRKRHALFAPVPGRLRCGYCNTCLNPRMKQACITRRNQMRSMTSVA